MALRSTGREIVLNACQWGTEGVFQWIRSSGANSFRSTIDIQDSWKSISSIARAQLENQCFNGPGCFNDMDMLVVGMYGKGMNPETSMGGCTDTEYQTHFALWSMMNAPLIIGCDIRSMNEKTKEILTNKELIAINQDLECRSCYQLATYGNPDAFILIKQLSGAEYAVGFFNLGDANARIELSFWDMGLPASSGMGLTFRDCLNHMDMGLQTEFYAQTVEPHGCREFRCKVEAR